MKLWVDDERPAPEGWVLAKTSAEAIEILGANEVTEMSLDYSLGRGDTGDNVLYWLRDYNGRWPGHISAHSSSYDGRLLIEEMVRAFRPTIKGE